MASLAPKEHVTARIVRVLAPHIGENMARASVHGHCDKLGFGLHVDEKQVVALVNALSTGLNVFVGREKANEILGEIRLATAALSA